MDESEAQQHLSGFTRQRLQQRFIVPVMIFCAIFSFAALMLDSALGNLVLLCIFLGWVIYSKRRLPM